MCDFTGSALFCLRDCKRFNLCAYKDSLHLCFHCECQNDLHTNFYSHFRPLIVAYYDVNFDHQFVKDTQFIRKKIIDVAKKYTTSNLRFAISNEAEFEEEIAALGFVDNGEDVSIACFTEKQKFR